MAERRTRRAWQATDLAASALGAAFILLCALAGAWFRVTGDGPAAVLQPELVGPAGWLEAPTAALRSVTEVQRDAVHTITATAFAMLVAALLVAGIAFLVLVFTRFSRRRSELATRAALGASPVELLRELAHPISRFILQGSAAGVGLGVVLTVLAFRGWPGLVERSLPAALAWLLLGAATGAWLLLTVILGMLWLFVLRGRLAAALQVGDRATASLAETRVREAFTILQIGASITLLAAGTVLSDLPERRTTVKASEALVVAAGTLDEAQPTDAAARVARLEQLLKAASEAPGVQAESIASAGALLGVSLRDRLYSECTNCMFSIGPLPFTLLDLNMHSVGPGFFALLGVRLLRGRDFRRADGIGAEAVVIVNDSFVRALFGPRGSGLGRVVRLRLGFDVAHRIIGVVPDQPDVGIGAPGAGRPVVWFSALQHPPLAFDLIARVNDADAESTLPAQFSSARPQRLSDRFAAALGPLELASHAVRTLSLLCIVLAALGLHATTSMLTRGRRRELGIRVALGSSSRQLLSYVIGYALKLGMVGVIVGVLGSFAAQRILSEVLPSARISGASFLLAAASLVLLMCGAVLPPAWQAAREQPANPLRSQ